MTKAQQLGIKKFPYMEFNSFGKMTYYEGASGFWYKYDYNSNGDELYNENSDGYGWFLIYENNQVIKQINEDFKEHYLAYKRNLLLNKLLND